MEWVLIVAAVWLALALVVGLLLGRGIRLADRLDVCGGGHRKRSARAHGTDRHGGTAARSDAHVDGAAASPEPTAAPPVPPQVTPPRDSLHEARPSLPSP